MMNGKTAERLEARIERLQHVLNGPSFRVLGLADRVLRRLKRTLVPNAKSKKSSSSARKSLSSPSLAIVGVESSLATPVVVFSRTSRAGTPPIPAISQWPPPTVSVVMTTFNAADTVEAAIWSLLNQSYPVSEVVISDDLSTDNTRDVVARMAAVDPRIRLICMPQNRGTFWAKNTALTVVTGEVVTFMDSDDISMPKRIEMQLKALARPGTVASLCACVRVDETGTVIMNRGLRSRTAPVSLMFHRSILRDVGYFDTVRTSADSEFQERLKATYGRQALRQVAEPLYVARVRDGSLSNDPLNSVNLGESGGFLSPARQAYQDGFSAWHAAEVSAGRRPYVCFPVSERPFPVTGRLLVSDDPDDPTTISAFMATYPPRLEQLQQVVPTLIGQVDRLYIYLNEFDTIPEVLKHDRIFPVVGGERNFRDAGKFFSVGEAPKGYWFFVDDDIGYPDDYCDVLVRAIERHRRDAIVGVHGVVLGRPLDRYFSDQREVYRYQDAAQERHVNLIGTGTAAMHSSVMNIDEKALSSVGMADIYLGAQAKRSEVPMIIVKRDKQWLKPMALPSGETTLYEEFLNRDELQTSLLRAEGDWTLEVDRLMDGARG